MPPPTKRRKVEPKIEEITFDLSARQEYLTGFHKRKLQRAKQAQEAAERRAREERIAERKRIRDERKADLERHVQELDALMQPGIGVELDGGEDEQDKDGAASWDGLEDVEPPPIDHEAEYIDEDKYTTVTVEAIDPSRDGLAKLGQDIDAAGTESDVQKKIDYRQNNKKTVRVKTAAEKERQMKNKLNKRKKRDFKYESRTDRKVSRMKEKVKSRKQASARKAG